MNIPNEFTNLTTEELVEKVKQLKMDRKHLGFSNQEVWNHCQHMIRKINTEIARRCG